MDWGRAKSIFIISFFALNVVLGYELWVGKWNAAGSKEVSADIAEEVNRLMQARGIEIAAAVPKEVPKMREIVVKWVEGETSGRLVTLPDPIGYNLVLNKGSLKELSQQGIPKIESYIFDKVTSNENVLMLNQLVGDYPLFDVNLELYTREGKVKGYRQSFVEVDPGQADKEEKKVISAYTVLRTLIDKYLPYGSVITDIRLGYHGQYFDTEKWTELPAFPTWRVALENGDIFYVHGFRGDVENPAQAKENL